MPDWTNYINGNDSTLTYRGIEISYIPAVALTATQIQEQYAASRREQERLDYFYHQMWESEQQRRREELEQEKQLQEDKRKYPLFFLKEGIV